MCQIFEKYHDDIVRYCFENNLDSNKVFKSAKSFNNELVFLQHPNLVKLKEEDKWRCDIPAPITLKMFAKNNKLEFEQTEYTRQGLSYDKV